MKLARSREWKVNMGNYEHEQFSALIAVDITDLFTDDEIAGMTPDEQMAALREYCERHLDQQLNPELEHAAELSQAEKSILPEPQPKAPPRRTEKVQRRSTR